MVKSENSKIKKEPSKALSSIISSTSSSALDNNKKKKYKGVRMRTWGSWVSEIRAPNQKTRIWLGSYSNPEAAARAYDAALLCLKGSSATNLNFPIASSHYYIPPKDNTTLPMSPKSIQRVAAAAANTFINNVDNNISSTNSTTTPPSASSSMASSPSDQIDDDVSLVSSYDDVQAMTTMMEPWFGLDGTLQSPKYVDQMFTGCSTASFFDIDSSHLINNDLYLYEESADDIRLWNFS